MTVPVTALSSRAPLGAQRSADHRIGERARRRRRRSRPGRTGRSSRPRSAATACRPGRHSAAGRTAARWRSRVGEVAARRQRRDPRPARGRSSRPPLATTARATAPLAGEHRGDADDRPAATTAPAPIGSARARSGRRARSARRAAPPGGRRACRSPPRRARARVERCRAPPAASGRARRRARSRRRRTGRPRVALPPAKSSFVGASRQPSPSRVSIGRAWSAGSAGDRPCPARPASPGSARAPPPSTRSNARPREPAIEARTRAVAAAQIGASPPAARSSAPPRRRPCALTLPLIVVPAGSSRITPSSMPLPHRDRRRAGRAARPSAASLHARSAARVAAPGGNRAPRRARRRPPPSAPVKPAGIGAQRRRCACVFGDVERRHRRPSPAGPPAAGSRRCW